MQSMRICRCMRLQSPADILYTQICRCGEIYLCGRITICRVCQRFGFLSRRWIGTSSNSTMQDNLPSPVSDAAHNCSFVGKSVAVAYRAFQRLLILSPSRRRGTSLDRRYVSPLTKLNGVFSSHPHQPLIPGYPSGPV